MGFEEEAKEQVTTMEKTKSGKNSPYVMPSVSSNEESKGSGRSLRSKAQKKQINPSVVQY